MISRKYSFVNKFYHIFSFSVELGGVFTLDVLTVVENIQRICKNRGITPTAACKESGAGKDLVTNMKTKGTQPSIERIRLLAQYLGVTTGTLLGEEKQPSPSNEGGLSSEAIEIASAYDQATEKEQNTVRLILSDYLLEPANPRPIAARGKLELSNEELCQIILPKESAELP